MSIADPVLGTTDQQIADMGNVERKRYAQKINLVKQLYENGPSSILDLFTNLNISHPTCQNLISELTQLDLIEKKGKGSSIGGRKPDLYGLKDGGYYVVSVDMERFKVRAAIFDNNNNNISGIKSLPLSISKDLSVLYTIRDFIDTLIADADIDKNKILGVGISMPGLISSQEYINYTYLSEGNLNLKESLKQLFSYPVFIENDVKSATIAESRHGLAKNRKDALVVLLDWGIGLGIIMDGKIRKGAKGFSGEIGHMPFVDDGALCYCGKRGCLETVASGIALARMVKQGIKSGQHSLLNRLSGQEINEIEPHIVIEAANQGDQFAISMLSKLGNSLGKGIATLIQLFNPEVIILGGKIAEAKQYITIPIIQSINTYSMAKIREDTKVTLSELQHNASLMGNISIVIDGILDAQIRKATI